MSSGSELVPTRAKTVYSEEEKANGYATRFTFGNSAIYLCELAKLAEAVGFEPTVPFGTTVFKTASLSHSDTPPRSVKRNAICALLQ